MKQYIEPEIRTLELSSTGDLATNDVLSVPNQAANDGTMDWEWDFTV